MIDWEWEDGGGQFVVVPDWYEFTLYKWVVRQPVPYKKNKHRYGR